MITSKQVEKIRSAIHEQVNEIHEQVDKQLDELVKRFHENKSVRRLMVDILHEKEGGVCGGCGETFQARNMELDHIVAKSSGGSYCIDNRQVLCGACNREKGKKPMREFLKKKGGHSNEKTNIRMSGVKDWEFMEAIVLENKPNSMSASEVADACIKKKLWRGSGRKVPDRPAGIVGWHLKKCCGLPRTGKPMSEELVKNAKIKEIVIDGKLHYVAK